ncbi:DUF58 domain-containing protein [Ginsengibacter hankyongi]|uniref:DUF58 domain-containing protein n=1 Tax=Ginsengibacter hankyongi TaxID=2607284 RepID=A0A5J5IKY0_9BACT|nr:DUF58 domain-containing protein [Ginsengibacter hankyongi]KAA9041726.1 DUF58 domain-containing protein [Ginsengibacter hankyongi]
MLTTAEIVKKVKELEIISKKITTHLFTGEYHSAFKGKGMSFREVREYYHGDDVRFIDWNVSARYAHPFTKVFEEERELTVILLVDVSASALFGTVHSTKRNLITEIGAVLTFSAINNDDKVGVIFFSDKIEKYIPPKKGKQHALYIVRELLTAQPKRTGTNINEALKLFSRSNRHRSIAFIMSDFIDEQYEDALRVMASRHDVIGLKIYDKMDMQLPNVGLMEVEDLETGKTQWLDTSDALVRHSYQQNFMKHSESCKNIFKKSGADLLHLRTDEDYVKILQQFFLRRK